MGDAITSGAQRRKERVSMRLEYFTLKSYLSITGAFVAWLLLAIIIGATGLPFRSFLLAPFFDIVLPPGPSTYFERYINTYNCANSDHLTAPCEGGVELGSV